MIALIVLGTIAAASVCAWWRTEKKNSELRDQLRSKEMAVRSLQKNFYEAAATAIILAEWYGLENASDHDVSRLPELLQEKYYPVVSNARVH